MTKVFLISIALFIAGSGFSQSETLRLHQFNTESGLAIHGYDPVAYFKEGKAVKGKKEWMSVYEGITYYFDSPDNRQAFLKSPGSFEPQFGGWCAFAMGESGKKVDIDPKTFKIVNGHLYLFYNAYFNNTLKSWNKDENRLQKNANTNWSNLYK